MNKMSHQPAHSYRTDFTVVWRGNSKKKAHFDKIGLKVSSCKIKESTKCTLFLGKVHIYGNMDICDSKNIPRQTI